MGTADGTAEQMLDHAAANAQTLAAGDLSARPARRVAVLSCMDTRIDLFALLGLARGEAHLLRNAGGLVTEDAIRSLSISQRKLGTEEVIVVMHDRCGLLGADDDEFERELAAAGASVRWRMGAFTDVEQALREGLARLRSAPELAHRDRISGFVFDPQTGALREP
jgi:carbonic anhydrase